MQKENKRNGKETGIPEEAVKNETPITGQEPVEETEKEAETETENKETEKSEQDLLAEKYNDLNDRYLRLMAEYDNFRKRSAKEREDIAAYTKANVIASFLPVLDNFERAAEFPHQDDEFGKGFDMIYESMKTVLKDFGVEAVGAVGDPFNPDLHNAVMHIEDEELGENVISQVLQKGYRLGERVIRYAMVQTAN